MRTIFLSAADTDKAAAKPQIPINRDKRLLMILGCEQELRRRPRRWNSQAGYSNPLPRWEQSFPRAARLDACRRRGKRGAVRGLPTLASRLWKTAPTGRFFERLRSKR